MINLYCIFDKVLKHHYSPLPEYTDEDMLKQLREIACNTDTYIGKCPAKFDVYKIGTFDTKTGNIEACYEKIANMAELVEV